MRKGLFLLLVVSLYWACEKDPEFKQPEEVSKPYHYELLDTMNRVFSLGYLWKNEVNPPNWKTYTDPAKFVNDFRYSKIDRWSHYKGDVDIDAINNGTSTTWPILFQGDRIRDLYVGMVSNKALKDDLKRGMQITHINDKPVTYTHTFMAGQSSVGELLQTQTQLKLGLKIYELNSDQKRDYSKFQTKNLTIKKSTFTQDPLPTYWTKTIDGVSYGYLLHINFVGSENGYHNIQKIKQAFQEFQAKKVTHLILDLRYNGGGYGVVSSYMAALIIPESKRKPIIGAYRNSYSTQNVGIRRYGDKIDFGNGKHETLGEGPVLNDLTKVSVLISDRTGSASEILMLNISVAFDLNLIGQSDTAGKFFGGYYRSVHHHGKDWYYYMLELQAINGAGVTGEMAFSPKFVVDDEPHYSFDNIHESLINPVIYPNQNKPVSNHLFLGTTSGAKSSILNPLEVIPFTIERLENKN